MIKIETMNIQRNSGQCSLWVILMIPEAAGLRGAQALTLRLAAELVEAIDPDIELADYKGSIRADPSVTAQPGLFRTFISMEAMDESDLEKAAAVAEFVHDQTELLE